MIQVTSVLPAKRTRRSFGRATQIVSVSLPTVTAKKAERTAQLEHGGNLSALITEALDQFIGKTADDEEDQLEEE